MSGRFLPLFDSLRRRIGAPFAVVLAVAVLSFLLFLLLDWCRGFSFGLLQSLAVCLCIVLDKLFEFCLLFVECSIEIRYSNGWASCTRTLLLLSLPRVISGSCEVVHYSLSRRNVLLHSNNQYSNTTVAPFARQLATFKQHTALLGLTGSGFACFAKSSIFFIEIW